MSQKDAIVKQLICRISNVPHEAAARVFPIFGRDVKAWRTGDKIRAASNVFQHLGGPLECKDGAFVCPSGGARFAMTDGRRLDDPVLGNARLMILPTRMEKDDLVYAWGERHDLAVD